MTQLILVMHATNAVSNNAVQYNDYLNTKLLCNNYNDYRLAFLIKCMAP